MQEEFEDLNLNSLQIFDLVAALAPSAKQNDPVQIFIVLQWVFLLSSESSYFPINDFVSCVWQGLI